MRPRSLLGGLAMAGSAPVVVPVVGATATCGSAAILRVDLPHSSAWICRPSSIAIRTSMAGRWLRGEATPRPRRRTGTIISGRDRPKPQQRRPKRVTSDNPPPCPSSTVLETSQPADPAVRRICCAPTAPPSPSPTTTTGRPPSRPCPPGSPTPRSPPAPITPCCSAVQSAADRLPSTTRSGSTEHTPKRLALSSSRLCVICYALTGQVVELHPQALQKGDECPKSKRKSDSGTTVCSPP